MLNIAVGLFLFSELRKSVGVDVPWLLAYLVIGSVMLWACGMTLAAACLNMSRNGMFLSEGIAGIVYLLSGVVFLLVMLPFLFIRLFYAPWLEARVRLRAPREVPSNLRDHVIIAEFDAVAQGLRERLIDAGIPYVILEPDPGRAGQMFGDRIWVLTGENDSRATYERAAAGSARPRPSSRTRAA